MLKAKFIKKYILRAYNILILKSEKILPIKYYVHKIYYLEGHTKDFSCSAVSDKC